MYCIASSNARTRVIARASCETGADLPATRANGKSRDRPSPVRVGVNDAAARAEKLESRRGEDSIQPERNEARSDPANENVRPRYYD